MLKNTNINKPNLSIIVPCYNEEGVIEIFLQHIEPILKKSNKSYEIIFINDGSSDDTFDVMIGMKKKYQNLRILNLSRNFGKEAALTAGLEYSRGDAVIPIDVDLQDPPELIIKFVEKWEEGYDVVLAKRADRTSDSFAKRLSASFFYKIHNKISDISIPNNVGDYRLMSRRVINRQFPPIARAPRLSLGISHSNQPLSASILCPFGLFFYF